MLSPAPSKHHRFTSHFSQHSTISDLFLIAEFLGDCALIGKIGARRTINREEWQKLFGTSNKLVQNLALDIQQYSKQSNGKALVAIAAGPSRSCGKSTLQIMVPSGWASGLFREYKHKEIELKNGSSFPIELIISGNPQGQGRDHSRPASLGCSIGHQDQMGGSIGCLVKKRNETQSNFYALSAAHVLAREGAQRGVDIIWQPAKSQNFVEDKDKNKTRTFARLVDYTEMLNGVDADAAIVGPVNDLCYEKNHYTGIKPLGWRDPIISEEGGERVQIAGAGSDQMVEGVVSGYLSFCRIDLPGFGHRKLVNMFAIDAKTNPGDSGAAVVGEDKKVLGIVTGYVQDPGYVIATFFRNIRKRLDVELAI